MSQSMFGSNIPANIIVDSSVTACRRVKFLRYRLNLWDWHPDPMQHLFKLSVRTRSCKTDMWIAAFSRTSKKRQKHFCTASRETDEWLEKKSEIYWMFYYSVFLENWKIRAGLSEDVVKLKRDGSTPPNIAHNLITRYGLSTPPVSFCRHDSPNDRRASQLDIIMLSVQTTHVLPIRIVFRR